MGTTTILKSSLKREQLCSLPEVARWRVPSAAATECSTSAENKVSGNASPSDSPKQNQKCSSVLSAPPFRASCPAILSTGSITNGTTKESSARAGSLHRPSSHGDEALDRLANNSGCSASSFQGHRLLVGLPRSRRHQLRTFLGLLLGLLSRQHTGKWRLERDWCRGTDSVVKHAQPRRPHGVARNEA